MNIKPLGNRIIIDQEEEHDKTDTGLYISTDVRSYRYGTIKALGPDCKHYSIGDRVLYIKEASEEIIVDEGLPSELKFVILYNENDIYAKIT